MPLPKTVSAQDFMCEISVIIDEDNILGHRIDTDTVKKFDALLSRARQEARREALKEMDEAHGKIDVAAIVKEQVKFSEGMDALDKLRQEYQTN